MISREAPCASTIVVGRVGVAKMRLKTSVRLSTTNPKAVPKMAIESSEKPSWPGSTKSM